MRSPSNLAPVVVDALTFARNLFQSRNSLAAENLFLRKQLTFYVGREQRPRRTDNVGRFTSGVASCRFDTQKKGHTPPPFGDDSAP